MTRQEAIQELQNCKGLIKQDGQDYLDERDFPLLDMAIEALSERNKGEWIKATGMMPPEFHGHHCCSECGNFANMEPPFGNREDLSNFCPNCGADMRNGM